MIRFAPLAALSLLAAPLAAQRSGDPLAPLPTPIPTPAPAPPRPAPAVVIPVETPLVTRRAPALLEAEVRSLGQRFAGRAGIAVLALDEGWEIGWNQNVFFPQQSCSKLWVSVAALDAIDRGRLTLDTPVTLGRADATLFNQPILARLGKSGTHQTSVRALMTQALTLSDNTANDKLMRVAGGPDAVRAMIAAKGLGAIRFYEGERALQSRIAGLVWSPRYSVGRGFEAARAALPVSVRRNAFETYIADPYDGAQPQAVARALARLARGSLLSPASTRHLLDTMGRTRTGKARVRAALAPGWRWQHKTGTGQNFQGRVGGINDIGLLRARDGRTYALALMTVPNRSDGDAQALMQAVTRAIIAAHAAG